MPRDSHPTERINEFAGLDNRNATHEVGTDNLTTALNVDVTRKNKIKRRVGYTQASATVYTSVWSDGTVLLGYAADGIVYVLDSNFNAVDSLTTLQNFGPHTRIHANRILDTVIFSNGTACGLYDISTNTELSLTPDTSDAERNYDHSEPVGFDDVETFNGRNFYAHQNYLYYSPVFGYYRLRKGRDYFRFPDTVTMVAQVTSGLFVSTLQKIYFLQGQRPEEMVLQELSASPAIMGTKTYAEGSVIGQGEPQEKLPVWTTSDGFFIGLSNGGIAKVNQTSVALPQGFSGSSVFKKQATQNQVISVIRS